MNVKGTDVLILIADGYHEHEFWYPYYRLKEAGARVRVAAPVKRTVSGEGRSGMDGLFADPDMTTEEARGMDFDGVFVPGGIYGPMELRADANVMDILKKTAAAGKWIASICHGPWVLVSAGLVNGKKIACPFDMSPDVVNAGGIYIAEGAIADGNIYTAEYYRYLPELFQLLLA